jgi:hypothetical protein
MPDNGKAPPKRSADFEELRRMHEHGDQEPSKPSAAAAKARKGTRVMIDAAEAVKQEPTQAVAAASTPVKPKPVKADKLANDLYRWFRDHIVFDPDHADAQAVCLTLWTLHTHTFDAWMQTPYLLIPAPVPEAGKTMLCKVLKPVVRDAAMASSMSPAAMARNANAGNCLLLDEADQMQEDREIRRILNSGYDVDGSVEVADPGDPYGTITYRTFSPKAFAGIAGKKLPITGATVTRCIVLPLVRKLDEENIKALDDPKSKKEAERLQGACQTWGAAALDPLAAKWGKPPSMPSGLGSRWVQVWTPLVFVADQVSAAWGKRGREAMVKLAKLAPEGVDENTMFVLDLFHAFKAMGWPEGNLHSDRLLMKLNTLPTPAGERLATTKKLSAMLRNVSGGKIKPEPQAIFVGKKKARGYVVDQVWYDMIFRILPRECRALDGAGEPGLPFKFWPTISRPKAK